MSISVPMLPCFRTEISTIGAEWILWVGNSIFILSEFLLPSFALVAYPVSLDLGLLLVDRPLAFGQVVLSQEQRGDLLALYLLLNRVGDGCGKGAHALGGLQGLAHQAGHRVHVFLAVHVHLCLVPLAPPR